MHLGPATDYFDVNNISAVAILPDLSYAFVSAFNQFIQGDASHDPNFDPAHPAGSNIGIVKDPFGLAGSAQLVAATRPIPNSFMDNLVLAPDGKTLYAGYRGNSAVFAFDVQAMLAEVQDGMAFGDRLQRFPVDDMVNGNIPVDHFNPLIDIRADYRIVRDVRGFPALPYTFQNIDPALAPIGTGGGPQGLDAQPDGNIPFITETAGSGTADAPPPSPSTQLGQAIFIAHGKNKKPYEQLKAILDSFKLPYKVAIEEPNLGRPIGEKVREIMDSCNCAILIFTADEEFRDKEGNPVWRPSQNIVYELGAAGYLYGKRIVVMKEDCVVFPSDFRDIGYIEFQKDKLSEKSMDIIKELLGMGILKLSKME